MGLLGRLTGWDQQKDAHNAVVASNFIETAPSEVKKQILKRIVEIQRNVKGRYAGSSDEIIEDLNNQPRSVQMNFVALACNSLGIQPSVKGLYFNDVQNPYLAKADDTTERIDGVVRFINARYSVRVSWPGQGHRIDFREWPVEKSSGASPKENSGQREQAASRTASQWTRQRQADAETEYEAAVHHILKNEFDLDRSTQWRVRAYDEVIAQSMGNGHPAIAAALDVAAAYFVAQCLGDASDREDASHLLSTLHPRINLAGVSGEISTERAAELSAVVRKFLDQKVERDLSEATGIFSPDRLNR